MVGHAFILRMIGVLNEDPEKNRELIQFIAVALSV
jgi:hypothetical protein